MALKKYLVHKSEITECVSGQDKLLSKHALLNIWRNARARSRAWSRESWRGPVGARAKDTELRGSTRWANDGYIDDKHIHNEYIHIKMIAHFSAFNEGRAYA